MNLSFKKNYLVEEDNKYCVKGNLKCDCGSENFVIFHTGKQTKGIFAPNIAKTDHQILVQAKCSKCGKTIQLYDTAIDGEKPILKEHPELKKFIYKNSESFRVKIILDYDEVNYMTNKFFTIFIYLYNSENKEIVLYEE